MRLICRLTILSLLFSLTAYSAPLPGLAEQMARSAMHRWKDPTATGQSAFPKWSYDEGVLLKGIEGVWKLTGNGDYFNYIRHSIDAFVTDSGGIRTYRPATFKLDDINTGKLLLTLYQVTGQKKYWHAATLLREQLSRQPRTAAGGFWHKKIYPEQMWLDGLYMAEPFYARYAMLAHQDSDYADIATQFMLMEKHARDPHTGLLYHGWDASRKQAWANPATGDSPCFWDRAIGWYAMALVDALDYFPQHSRYADSLQAILQRLAAAIARYQDPKTGCWWQVMDKAGAPGNYPESSGSCMFVYTLAKGVRKGYLPAEYLAVASKGFQGILNTFVDKDADGLLSLKGTCAVAGLGGSPYRDGSYAYYTSQRPVTNDPKGVGAFILAAGEMQIASIRSGMAPQTVLLDHYFNDETEKDITGHTVPYHYVWKDRANTGFSFWGDIFRYRNARTALLDEAPRERNLKDAAVYIIVDPDTKAENPHPRYIQEKDIRSVVNWVRQGGTLVLLANDSGNCEFTHLNKLAASFGIRFNEDSRLRVQGHAFEEGAIDIDRNNDIFRGVRKAYMKDVSTLTLSSPATPVLKTAKGEVIAAIATVGKGRVFAVGDPWFYNEYTDGRKLPAIYENYDAACKLSEWLLQRQQKQ